jgi:hypothetical protein
VTEVLSGDYYQPLSTSSPHQIWSAAMVISPLLRGLLGLETDDADRRVIFSPHLPADWRWVRVQRVRAGSTTVDFRYRKTAEEISLEVESSGDLNLEFSPAISPRAELTGARANDRPVHVELKTTETDQHAILRTIVKKGKTTLRIGLDNDFRVSYQPSLADLGSTSRELRIIRETWSPYRLILNLAGLAGAEYDLVVSDPAQITSIEGGELKDRKLRIQIPGSQSADYVNEKVTIHLAAKRH